MKQLLHHIIATLSPEYEQAEAREMAYWIIEECYGYTRSDIMCERYAHVSDCKDNTNFWNTQENREKIHQILHRLLLHEPLQYIFGHTLWNGLDLLVTPATLIPRPETADLLPLIMNPASCINHHASCIDHHASCIDIGTGSGCIAIAAKLAHPDWEVYACDISEEALEVAKENARRNGAEVHFFRCDILAQDAADVVAKNMPDAQHVIVVSNPPYICDSERITMEDNVLQFEPHSALFVPDNDPLLFYRRIAELRLGEQLCFEINERFGSLTCAMLRELGYEDVSLHRDMFEKDRFVCAKNPL